MVLTQDYFSIRSTRWESEALLTAVGGKVVYAAGPYSQFDAPAPPVLPDWLPVRHYGGYHRSAAGSMPALVHHTHTHVIGDAGSWSTECPCGAF